MKDFKNFSEEELKSNVKLLLLSIVVALVLAAGSICLGGKVLCDMWNWFVVKATDWNEMSYVVGVGIWTLIDGMFISNITSSVKSRNENSDTVKVSINFSSIIAILLTWGIGAIVHCFM